MQLKLQWLSGVQTNLQVHHAAARGLLNDSSVHLASTSLVPELTAF